MRNIKQYPIKKYEVLDALRVDTDSIGGLDPYILSKIRTYLLDHPDALEKITDSLKLD